VPQQVVVIPMFLMMKQLGWVNTYWALIIPWAFTAFGTFLLRQFYMTIPYDLDEAAVIDGCSHFGIYWRIILPLVRTGLAALGVFTFIGYWNSLLWPLIITNQQSLYTLPIGLQMYHGQYGTQWNLLMAASTITVLPTMIIYLIAQRHIVQGITLSGIAGR
jgi:multiple sugar transport system permease protein